MARKNPSPSDPQIEIVMEDESGGSIMVRRCRSEADEVIAFARQCGYVRFEIKEVAE